MRRLQLFSGLIFLLAITASGKTFSAPVFENEIVLIRPELQTTQASPVREGEARAAVIARLGQPNTVAYLPGNRQVDHYYSERLSALRANMGRSVFQPQVSRAATDSSSRIAYLDRSLMHLEVFYEQGTVVRQQGSNESFSIPGRESRLNPYITKIITGELVEPANSQLVYQRFATEQDATFREGALWLRHTEPRISGGIPFSVASAKGIPDGSFLVDLLWTLGTPSRILNTAKGEWFIYELKRFKVESDKLISFTLERAAFLVRQARIVKILHTSKEWPVPDLAESRGTFLFADIASLWYVRSLDSHGAGQSIHKGEPYAKGEYFETMSAALSDVDFADVASDTDEMLQRIANNAISEDYYLFKGASMRARKPGETNFSELVGNDSAVAMRVLVQPDSNWLNFQSADKFYYTEDGRLDAILNFSLFAPHSPWYAFGPVTENKLGWEFEYTQCPFTAVCTRPLRGIFKNNLTIPWQ